MAFFILGYMLFADGRFTQAIRRDWPITLGVGIAAFLAFAAVTLLMGDINIEAAPRTLLDFAWWGLVAVSSWCWTAFVLFIGMRYLNHTNKWLQYGQEAILPFFVVHQPVIVVIAYFVVQWNTGIVPKMLAVFVGSFVMSIGFYESIIKRVGTLRAISGMKAVTKPLAVQPQEAAPSQP
jgi:surface polysaccharide O-acyltransferase-like enzyme